MTEMRLRIVKNLTPLKLIDSYTELSAHAFAARELLTSNGMTAKEAEKLVEEWNREAQEIVFKAAESVES